LAPSLRGHGDSPLTGPLNDCSIADYVRDIASVADGLPTPPGRDVLAVVGSPRLTRQAFFTPSTPESLIAQYSARLEQESHRALSADMMYRGPSATWTGHHTAVGAGRRSGLDAPPEAGPGHGHAAW